MKTFLTFRGSLLSSFTTWNLNVLLDRLLFVGWVLLLCAVLLCIILLCVALIVLAAESSQKAKIDFEGEVRPIQTHKPKEEKPPGIVNFMCGRVLSGTLWTNWSGGPINSNIIFSDHYFIHDSNDPTGNTIRGFASRVSYQSLTQAQLYVNGILCNGYLICKHNCEHDQLCLHMKFNGRWRTTSLVAGKTLFSNNLPIQRDVDFPPVRFQLLFGSHIVSGFPRVGSDRSITSIRNITNP